MVIRRPGQVTPRCGQRHEFSGGDPHISHATVPLVSAGFINPPVPDGPSDSSGSGVESGPKEIDPSVPDGTPGSTVVAPQDDGASCLSVSESSSTVHSPITAVRTEELFSHQEGLTDIEREVWDQQYNKSVKADDALTPTHLWDCRIWCRPHDVGTLARFRERFQQDPLKSLRVFLLRCWRTNIRKSLTQYLKSKHGKCWWKV